jgi:siroheme synthase
VEGPAAAAMAGFSLTDENYETAFKLLEETFANPQIIVSSHVDALLKLDLFLIYMKLSRFESCMTVLKRIFVVQRI